MLNYNMLSRLEKLQSTLTVNEFKANVSFVISPACGGGATNCNGNF